MAVHPIVGKYDVRDPTVIAKHIDWTTGHGIIVLILLGIGPLELDPIPWREAKREATSPSSNASLT